MRPTGRKTTESFARRVAARERRAVALESFCALMLKYLGFGLENYLDGVKEELTVVIKASFSARNSFVWLKIRSCNRSLNRSKRALADRATATCFSPSGARGPGAIILALMLMLMLRGVARPLPLLSAVLGGSRIRWTRFL